MMGLLPGKINVSKYPGVVTTYGSERKNKKRDLYWQTLNAYYTAIGRRVERGQKGKKGLLVETAKILEEKYGWPGYPDSYIVRRYLDRAEKIWHSSTKVEILQKRRGP
jgi:predicted RNA-binding protein (virulence factor B family)